MSTSFENLKKVIAYVESRNNQFVFRFEKELYKRDKYDSQILNKIQVINECSNESAKVIYCSSFGKYQIMGFNLYSVCNIDYNVFCFMCDEKKQDKAFINFLIRRFHCDLEKIYSDFVENIFKELEYALELKKTITKTSDFLEVLKDKRESFPNIIKFIRVYNGSVFPSTHALDYFLRMLYYYENKIKNSGG